MAHLQNVPTYTLLDFKLGHVQLTEDQQRQIRERVVPVLARVAQRVLREQRAAEVAHKRAAAGRQGV